ncbi:hypothetical protein [Caballeronia sp. Sq4a]|uniref:hypothetical protein n=1 Tax=Caballeronia sp. Sq4a TaxID=2878152 RepID=UPI0020C1490B|nr:hypothetical protein [Caballeronia sp. Sq4a]
MALLAEQKKEFLRAAAERARGFGAAGYALRAALSANGSTETTGIRFLHNLIII